MHPQIDKLLAEEAEHKQQVAQLQQQARQLQITRDAAQQELATEQKAAANAEEADEASGSGHKALSKASAAAAELQQQLAAVGAEVAQLQATKAAAAAKATRAAVAVADAGRGLQEMESAAARTVDEISKAQENMGAANVAVRETSSAVHVAEQQWKEAHWQQRQLQVSCQHIRHLAALSSQ